MSKPLKTAPPSPNSPPNLYETPPYRDFLTLCKSPHTAKNYHQDLLVLQQFLVDSGEPDPTKVTPKLLLQFAAALSRPGATPLGKPRGPYSTRSLKRILACVRSFYRYLAASQLIQADPTAVFHNLRIHPPKRNPRPLSTDERRALFSALRDDTDQEIFLALVVRLGLECGLRVSEIAGLRRQDVDLSSLQLTVIGKGDKERSVPMTREIARLFQARFQSFEKPISPYVFPSPRDRQKPIDPKYLENALKTIAHRADMASAEALTIHVLRHTFGTCLAEAGASAYEIRDLMGHSSIAVSEHYVKLASKAARQAYERAFGRGGRNLAVVMENPDVYDYILQRKRIMNKTK